MRCDPNAPSFRAYTKPGGTWAREAARRFGLMGRGHLPVVRSEPWYRRTARGALAGGVATLAMSAVQFPVTSAGGRRPPPIEITRRLHLWSGRRPSEPSLWTRGFLFHLVFGAACGALYATVAPRRLRRVTAPAYAGLIYAGSYRGYLPATGLHPHSADDDARRQVANVAGHVVYGLTLAELLRVTEPKDEIDESIDNERATNRPRSRTREQLYDEAKRLNVTDVRE